MKLNGDLHKIMVAPRLVSENDHSMNGKDPAWTFQVLLSLKHSEIDWLLQYKYKYFVSYSDLPPNRCNCIYGHYV